jgi:TM2 domain-containing membrane protein YozV
MKILTLYLILLSGLSFSQSHNNNPIFLLEHELKSVEPSGSLLVQPIALQKSDKKNAGLAIIFSLVLPGIGELYAGDYSTGKFFTIADGALWGILIGMNTYAGWQKDRYISFAQSKSGVNTAGKDEEYFATIGEYMNIDQYNNQQALRRSFNKMYFNNEYDWNWQSQEDRRSYRSMWVNSEQAYNNIRFVVGAMLINRLASAINAVRLVAAYNKKRLEEDNWSLSMGVSSPMNLPTSFTINFHTSF